MIGRSKELLLASVVSREVESIGKKFEFWEVEFPEVETLWEHNPVGLSKVLEMINEDDLNKSENLKLLYCIGWEFVWGVRPPDNVSYERECLQARVFLGRELNSLEQLWVNLIKIDTDMF